MPRPVNKAVIGIVVGVIVAVIIIAAVLAIVFIKGGSGNKTVTMTCAQLSADIVTDMTHYTINFRSLNAGDTVIVSDTISSIYYNSYDHTTTIYMSGSCPSFTFEGDLTSTYYDGDHVQITLHITNFEANIGGITISGEYFEEMYNPQTHSIDETLSPNIIRKVG